ncbi:hypothetical protein LIER_23987 [Lithospermum erythrorhizon]|uniref:Gag-protease polyprotein n=1 Tax=Lithospermum erythrorhizon TaxID=34254 RepID=A0AAV3QZE0_LITER
MSNEKLIRKVLRTLPKRCHSMMRSSKKNGIALKASSNDVNDEDLVETMNLLAKNFNKTLKRFNKKFMEEASETGNNRWKKPVKQGNYDAGQSDRTKGIQSKMSVQTTSRSSPRITPQL